MGSYTNRFAFDGAGNPTTFKGATQAFNTGNQNNLSKQFCMHQDESAQQLFGHQSTSDWKIHHMSITTWILQKKADKAYSMLDSVKQACLEIGRPFVEVTVTPLSQELPPMPPINSPFIFYGYTTLILSAYNSMKWRQGIFFDPLAFRPESYRQHYGELFLNSDMQVTTFAELDASGIDPRTNLFLRPNDDLKHWEGQVMTFGAFREWYKRRSESTEARLTPRSALVYSSAKQILSEWRVFLVAGRAVGACLCLPVANPFVPGEVIAFAESAAELWSPVSVLVMDLAKTAEGEFRIVELNCFNGCGFYVANVSNIVRSVSRYMESR